MNRKFPLVLTDNPDLDGTDPAWWRGNDAGVVSLCRLINGILDGKDDGKGVSAEPWHSTRMGLIDLRKALEAFLRAPSVGMGSTTIEVQDYNLRAARKALREG